MEKKSIEMTPDEKQELHFKNLLTPKDPEGNALKFQNPEAESNYKKSITRIKDAIQLKKSRTGCRLLYSQHVPLS